MKQGFIWAEIFHVLYHLIYQKIFLTYFQSLGDIQKEFLLKYLGGSALILLILFIGLHIYVVRMKKHFFKTTIRELRREHRLLKVALASIGEGIITTDKEAKVNFISSAAQEMTGFSEKEAMGRSIGEIFHVVKEDTGEPLEIPISAVIREGKTFQLEENAALISKNGNRYLIADSVAPIRNNKDRIIGAVVTFQDVTKARKAEEVKSAVYKIASVSNNSNSLKECFTEIHRVLGSIIDADNFYIALYDSEKELINFAYYVDEYEKVYNL